MERCKIIIGDARETKCNNLLQNKKANFKKEFLEVGDHLLPKSMAVERKKGKDFLASITDKRLYKQLNNIYQYDYPILAIITPNIWMDMYFSRNKYNQNVHNVYEGALKTIYSKYPKVRVIFFETDEEYVDFLISMDDKLTGDGKNLRPTPMTRKATSMKEIRENVLAAIPGVGIAMSKKLLKKYNTVGNIAEADIKDLMTIDKLGEKTATKIKETLN